MNNKNEESLSTPGHVRWAMPPVICEQFHKIALKLYTNIIRIWSILERDLFIYIVRQKKPEERQFKGS